jgi:hypothetical protein
MPWALASASAVTRPADLSRAESREAGRKDETHDSREFRSRSAMARRSGSRWFVAVINGAEAKTLDIPLDFLGAGPWKATELRDAEGKPDGWDRREGQASKTDHLTLPLAPRGGFVGSFTK